MPNRYHASAPSSVAAWSSNPHHPGLTPLQYRGTEDSTADNTDDEVGPVNFTNRHRDSDHPYCSMATGPRLSAEPRRRFGI